MWCKHKIIWTYRKNSVKWAFLLRNILWNKVIYCFHEIFQTRVIFSSFTLFFFLTSLILEQTIGKNLYFFSHSANLDFSVKSMYYNLVKRKTTATNELCLSFFFFEKRNFIFIAESRNLSHCKTTTLATSIGEVTFKYHIIKQQMSPQKGHTWVVGMQIAHG